MHKHGVTSFRRETTLFTTCLEILLYYSLRLIKKCNFSFSKTN
jgi:hypothetical protein